MNKLINKIKGQERKTKILSAIVIAVISAFIISILFSLPKGDVEKSYGFMSHLGSSSISKGTVTETEETCDNDDGLCLKRVWVNIGEDNVGAITNGQTRDVNPGDNVWVMDSTTTNGTNSFQIVDFNNVTLLMILLLIVIIAVTVFAGRKGVMAIMGVIFSCLVAGFYLVPLVASGQNAILPTVASGGIILAVIMFATHGVRKSTAIAYIGTVCSLILVGLAMFAVTYSGRITGLNDEEIYGAVTAIPSMEAAQLFSAAVIIGSLGLFNDIGISQASVVRELVEHNPKASRGNLTKAAMRIGQGHTSSIIYTVVLVFLGSSLPTVATYLNTEISVFSMLLSGAFALEIIKTSICVIALCASVPLTTLAAIALEHKGGDEDKNDELVVPDTGTCHH